MKRYFLLLSLGFVQAQDPTDTKMRVRAKETLYSFVRLQQLLTTAVSTDEVDGVLGQGPAFKDAVSEYGELVGDTTSIGFSLLSLDQETQLDEKLFIYQAIDSTRDQLDKVLQPQMAYIGKLMQTYDNDTCLQRYLISQDHAYRAYQALSDYVMNDTLALDEKRKGAFLDLCSDGACERTLDRLLYSLVGNSPSDCLALDLVHYGHPELGYQRGLSDLVISEGAYLLTLLTYAMSAQSAYLAITSTDPLAAYTDLHDRYKVQLRQAATEVLMEYDRSLKGFYVNAKANLQYQTESLLFDYGLTGDDLIAALIDYVRKYANRCNPQASWQLFVYQAATPQPVWCRNCFIVSNLDTQQHVVFFYTNATLLHKSQPDIQRQLQLLAAGTSSPADFKKQLQASAMLGLCISGMAFLPSLPRLFENGAMSEYTQVPSRAFSLLFWVVSSDLCLTADPDTAWEVINMDNAFLH